MFKDRVSAAVHYDIEATKVHGANAILNFPAGWNIRHTQPPVVPLGGGCGQGQPLATVLLPAGKVERSPAPASTTRRIKRTRRVSPVFWVVIRQNCSRVSSTWDRNCDCLLFPVKKPCPSRMFSGP
jgi:hypothetical protein